MERLQTKHLEMVRTKTKNRKFNTTYLKKIRKMLRFPILFSVFNILLTRKASSSKIKYFSVRY